MFGEKKDVPVRLVTFDSALKKASLDAFVSRWHAPPDRDHAQIFHVTIKNLGPEGGAIPMLVAPRLYMAVLGDRGRRVWTST